MSEIPLTDESMRNFETLVLEKVKLRSQAFMHPAIVSQCLVSASSMMAEKMLRVFVDMLVPGSKTKNVTEFELVPATWWDHLKQSMGLNHKTRRISRVETHYHVCPHLGVGGGNQQHFEWLQYAGREKRWLKERLDEFGPTNNQEPEKEDE